MPDQHCPTCGTARSAGCRCLPDPSLTETTVLPHLEGPPLVRPYVPQAVGRIVDMPPADAPADPFATTVLPPAQAPGAPPAGPDADAYATTVLPPVMSVPPPGPRPTVEQPPAGGTEIGYFPFDGAAPGGTGGRAARRAAEQAGEGMPARRKGLLVAAGAALLAFTVGLAYAVTPSAEPADRAQPAPSTTLAPAPVDPTTPAEPSPSAPPSTSGAPSPSPSRTAKPSPSRTAPPSATATTPAPAAPAPPAPATTPPAPTPTPTPSAPPSPTATTPTPTPTFQVLQYGMKGPNVMAMQQKLADILCWMSVPTNGNFDRRTESSVAYFQVVQGVQGDESGVYGPNTAAALAKRTTC
ncbi:peptidoglycan-binding domain-containing protein [Kitasatospora sp. NPDC003701]